MLTPIERLLFIALALFAMGATYSAFTDMFAIIQRGSGKLHFNQLLSRIWNALVIYVTQKTTLKTRRLTSFLHVGVVVGFTFYFLVNVVDILIGFFPTLSSDLHALSGFPAALYDLYRLLGDVLSIAVLVGVVYFIVRRLYLPNKEDLTFHENVTLYPDVKSGAITTDSMIVAVFILLHVGARFLGESVFITQMVAAGEGIDAFSPFASLVSTIWFGMDATWLEFTRHLFWWLALGGILVFLPYFPYTKHAHLFMAPLNFLTRPERTSLGELEPMDFEDEEIEQFGANTLTDLSKTQLFDAFACIMCNRCQDVCPAYTTGKELSPSALEVNKRYSIKHDFVALANGETLEWSLMDTVMSESAVWACTTCGACVDICPTGNEPMFDIVDIRRDAVLMQGEFPSELQDAFNGMERQGNPWGVDESRMKWAEGLDVPTVEENPDFDVLYWTGCAVSYDASAQKAARALVKVLRAADVNFAVLGEAENCTGDSARRAGNEYLYYELATANVETLNEVKPKRIVATCPHCLHTLGKEYHQFGGDYEVVHHTELINELIQQGKLPRNTNPEKWSNVTFHDPCYLGRHNDVIDAPREVLRNVVGNVQEMPRNKHKSFCCGAGGAQFWKEEEPGTSAVNIERYQEAVATGADILAVGCPFCMTMMEDAKGKSESGPEVKDVVELVAELLSD